MEAKEKYIEFCRKEDYLPLFLQPWYLDGVCPKNNWDAAVSERDGKVVGIFPFYKKFKKPYNYISMPPNAWMMGPYVVHAYRDQDVYRKIVKQMSKALPKVEFFYQSFHYAVTDWLMFYSQKYNGKKLYSFILNDFTDLTKTYSHLHRNIRDKAIPNAKKQVSIKTGLDPKIFYDMLVEDREAQNKKTEFKYPAFEKHYKSLIDNNAGTLFYACDKDKNIHSGGLLMWDNLSSYFYLAAEAPAFKYTNSLAYLTWHCIEFTAQELKLDFFDFGGNHVEASEEQNHPFGAIQVPFLNISRYDSQKFKPFKSIKKRVKRRR